MNYDEFVNQANEAGKNFLEQVGGRDVRIIGHFDTDGLCATAILELALKKENLNYVSTQVQSLDDDFIEDIAKDTEVCLFLDVGSNKENQISEAFKDKLVYILDHHDLEGESVLDTHINPHKQGIDERNAISGAGVAYFFVMGMNPRNRHVAHLAVLGALGDTQDQNGFAELNNRILRHAIIQKSVQVGKRLKLYGLGSRPLVKVLEYSSDIGIPGVTGSEDGVRALLDDLHISYEWKGRLKKWFHLRPFEQERLTEKILELKKDTPEEDLLVPTYNFVLERRRELRDGKEFATIINACGRLEQYDTALDALLGDDIAKEKAIMQLRVYKSTIRDALKQVDEMREHDELFESDKLAVINFGNSLPTSMAGIIASILARNKLYRAGTVVCTMARGDDETTKVSLRASMDTADVKLQESLARVVEPFDAASGGHDNAAGAVIKTEQEDAFVENLKKEFP